MPAAAKLIGSIALVILFSLSRAQAETAPVKIGFIGAFTGPVAYYGQAARCGIEMAREEIGDGASMEIIFEDDQFQAAKTVAAFDKLVELNKVRAVIGIGSTPSNAIAPIAEKKKIPLMVLAVDPKVTQGRKFIVRTDVRPEAEAAGEADEALRLGYRDIGILVSINDFSLAIRKQFLERTGPAAIRFDQEIAVDMVDVRPIIMRAMSKGAKQLFICALGQAGIIAKQSREIGFAGPMFGCRSMSVPEEYDRSQGALDGAWYYAAARSEDFERRFTARYGSSFDLRFAAVHYDLIYLLHEALIQTKDTGDLIPFLIRRGRFSRAEKSCRFIAADGDQYLECELQKYFANPAKPAMPEKADLLN